MEKLNKTMAKKVYGFIGVVARMANFNADFLKQPRTLSDGTVYASDKTVKFCFRELWKRVGELVFATRTYKAEIPKKKSDKDKKEHLMSILPLTLDESFNTRFGAEMFSNIESMDHLQAVEALMKAIDVKQFGSTFVHNKCSIGIKGAVQFSRGINIYDGTTIMDDEVLSPFSSADGKERSSIGSTSYTDEAHYLYSFIVDPCQYEELVKLGVTEGYTEEDYEKFKEAALICVTAFNSASKMGCSNEYAVFIETKDDVVLPEIERYVTFIKGAKGEKNRIEFNCEDLLTRIGDGILAINVYYNHYLEDFKVEGSENLPVKFYNIVTRQEL